MSQLYVSDQYRNSRNILYIRESISSLFFKKGEIRVIADKHRVGLFLGIEDNLLKPAHEELCDRIADVIAVGYKYEYFWGNLTLEGLSEGEKGVLVAALISADIDEDKRYIRSALKYSTDYAIDGIYNFRMRNLTNRWEEISKYIPPRFCSGELNEFIVYLLNEKRGRRVYVDNGAVFDKNFRRLIRGELLPYNQKLRILKEVLLSGAGEIQLKGSLPQEDERYLREYFGDKIYFKEQ